MEKERQPTEMTMVSGWDRNGLAPGSQAALPERPAALDRMRPVRLPVLLAAALLPIAAGAAPPPDATGLWDSPLGRVRIARDGAAVTGTLLEPSGPCGFEKGAPVLRATLLDDSLAGQVRVCTVGAGCPPDEWGTALLLVGPGKLSGAVHLAARDCRTPLGKKGGIAFTRAKAAAAARPPPPAPGPSAAEKAARRAKARDLLRDGAAYLGEGAFERARQRFEEAIAADAAIPEAYNGVGVTWRMRNDLERALEWYKKALSVDPDFGDAYYNMACVYALKGDRTLALRYLQIAAMNGYASAEGIDGDTDLSSLRTTREYRALRDRM